MRTPPRDRFGAPATLVDLGRASADLAGEAHEATRGHRQIALYKNAGTTLALFLFDAGGSMREHAAAGVATVHVLEGRIVLEVEGESHELTKEQVLVLAPGVRHNVLAREPSRLLLTVSLTPTSGTTV